MKSKSHAVLLGILSVFLLSSCSNSPKINFGMEYKHMGENSPFSSMVYVFSETGVSVFMEIGSGEMICSRKDNGNFITSADSMDLRGIGAAKGSTLSKGSNDNNQLVVVFGPGDQMPVLENASYKVQGSSIYVDWSKSHSKYFALSHCNAGAEVFTLKNGGLVMESSTTPGFTITMGGRAPSAMSYEEKMQAMAAEYQKHLRENAVELNKTKEQLRILEGK